jgi:hypothetical protein
MPGGRVSGGRPPPVKTMNLWTKYLIALRVIGLESVLVAHEVTSAGLQGIRGSTPDVVRYKDHHAL